MPVQIYWYEPETVLYVKLFDNLGNDLVKRTDAAIIQMLDSSPRRHVYFIYDCVGVRSLPSITALKALAYPKHPKAGAAGIFGLSTGLTFIAGITTRFFRSDFRFVKNLDEAVAWLARRSETLRDLQTHDVSAAVHDLN